MDYNEKWAYRKEQIREEARLDERERRDRIAKEAARKAEFRRKAIKITITISVYTFVGYMMYKTAMLFVG